MREFSTTISDALSNGLQPNESFRDTLFFEDMYNLLPLEIGTRSYQILEDVIPIKQEDRNIHYPFPQWFRLEHDNLLVTKDNLYEVVEFPSPKFDLKHLLTKEFSEPFREADYGGDWMLLNRNGTIYKLDGEIRTSSELKAAGLLYYKNRTVIGGASGGLWTDDFLRELEKITNLAELEKEDFSLDLGKNFVFWSEFDSRYFPMSFLHPEIMFNTFQESDPFTELLYSNSFGYMEMPFKGDILDMIESNDQVFVFGEDGLCSLTMNPDLPGSGMQITGQQSFGIRERGAVGGDESSFVFIDVFNQLWSVTSEGLQKHDYSEYMKELTDEVWITKDPEEEIFYIGDRDNSFLFVNQRLTRINQTVQVAVGAFPFRGGVAKKTGDNKARIKSERIDIGNIDNKTLTGIAIGTDSEVSGRARAHVQVGGKKVSTPWVALNPEGYAATRIYGSQHQIEIELDNFESLSIDHLELKWQVDDRRQRRGAFTTQDASGAG